MHNKDKTNVEDCLMAISRIAEYTRGILDKKELLADTKTYDAVLMNFVVIAEACKRLSTELKDENAQVDWAGVRQFRNYLAHDYFGVDIREVWEAIQRDLPKLKTDFEKILASLV